jgi:surfactin synthase thioesterase subunit
MADANLIVRSRPRAQAELRLFCFHHAGGGAAFFNPWAAALPARIELVAIRLPGRESAFSQPRFTGLETVVDAVAAAIGPLLDKPFAFFGHSLGALVAYRVAHRLDQKPRHLFCSAFRAPHLPRTNLLSQLPDADLVANLRKHGGIPDAVANHAELLDLMIPLFRDDLRLAELYVHDDAPPLDSPITAMAGEQDELAPIDELAQWKRHTSAAFRLLTYPGSHFYLDAQRARVIADIAAIIA